MVDLGETARSSTAPRVVLAPMNLSVALPEEVEEGAAIVEEALVRELQARGARVAMIWPADAQRLWQASVAGIERSGDDHRDLRNAARAFVDALHESEAFELVLFPSLVLREARVSGRHAQWDGVRRRIEVRARATDGAPIGAPDAPIFDGSGVAASPTWTGSISGLSLHLLALRGDRRRPRESWAGLDLVHDAVPVRGSPGSRAELELRPKAGLLEDREHVREGTTLALDAVRAPAR